MDISDKKRKIFAERLTRACESKLGKRHGAATFLGDALGVSYSTASRWLSGHNTPAPHRWGEIAEALDVTAAWLSGATHDLPKSLGEQDMAAARNVGRAAGLVFPLVVRLGPDLSTEEIERLVTMAHIRLSSGEAENAVSGEVARELLMMEKTR